MCVFIQKLLRNKTLSKIIYKLEKKTSIKQKMNSSMFTKLKGKMRRSKDNINEIHEQNRDHPLIHMLVNNMGTYFAQPETTIMKQGDVA